MRAPVSHSADLKLMAGSSAAAGAMGKAWVLEGKCHQFHCVGRRNTQTIFEKWSTLLLSAAVCGIVISANRRGTKCLIERKSCSVALVDDIISARN